MNTTEPKPVLEQFTVVERAIIYNRVSTDEQADSGTSLSNQDDKNNTYTAINNMQIVYTGNEDYTGKVLDRPELNKIREMLRAGLADNLIVYKTNRLDRSEWKQLIAGLRGYQAQQESKVEPIRRELAYVEELTKEKTAEWEDELLNMKVLSSERAKAKKAADIAQVERVLDELEKRKVNLLSQFEETSLTDEQIIGITAFASQVANDMATLREAEAKGKDMAELKAAVYEAKRRLLALLDVQVTLFVREGKRKARITAKYCPNGDVLSVELESTNSLK